MKIKNIILLLIIILFIIVGCTKNEENLNTNGINKQEVNKKEDDINMVNEINVEINNKTYQVTLENNETVKAFLEIIPQEFNMKELNGNEKYIYLDETLPTNPSVPSIINAGDVMLYGDDCLVIFYKSFKTSYSYTKIGHISNLEDLGKNNIIANFTK